MKKVDKNTRTFEFMRKVKVALPWHHFQKVLFNNKKKM